MAKSKAARAVRAPARDESALARRSRHVREREAAAEAQAPLMTAETRGHGDYHEGWVEQDGQHRRVLLNRGGSTIQRWLNAPVCAVLGDSERAAIRYCQSLWQRLDHKGLSLFRVDNGRPEGLAEHEAMGELAALKARLPRRHWDLFENICRFEHPAPDRQAKVVVGLVASLIAMWRGL